MTTLPFQIRRTDMEVAGDKCYRFELINTANHDAVLCVARGESPIAPEWIRKRQARYNTSALLDRGTP
jgi:hypothetical protein